MANRAANPLSNFRIVMVIVAALSLQACVAAALPALAGGAILRSEAARGEKDVAPSPVPDTPAAPQGETQFELVDGLDALPAPSPADSNRIERIYRSGFHEMVKYALTVAGSEQQAAPVPSAILTNPSKLDAKREGCSSDKYAVLIDLDESGRRFDPNSLAPTYDGDAYGHLSRLRDSGIAIGWMSALTAENAGSVRKALQVSGLDVKGEDDLVLLRYPNDRKQTRRAEFAANYCLIAIAGDERADFDELYEYLNRPDGAIALEKLIGDGWFLLKDGLPAKSE